MDEVDFAEQVEVGEHVRRLGAEGVGHGYEQAGDLAALAHL